MKYLLRDAVDLLTMPLAWMMVLALVALFLRWRGRPRGAFLTTTAGLVLLFLAASEPVASALLRPLESYPSLDDAHLPQNIAGIVVLGAYYAPRPNRPITAELPGSSLERIAEGVRLAKRYGNVPLLLSGGVPPGPGRAASSHGYAIFAREMGIDPASMIIVDEPKTTSEEVQALVKRYGQSPFLLVTSSFHMKRAMKLFEGTGAHPIPAPTDQRATIGFGSGFIPKSDALRNTQFALHEYLGILAISAGLG
jgi:uncharacterized SAM-binding protein YcdF (DUF218 family)